MMRNCFYNKMNNMKNCQCNNNSNCSNNNLNCNNMMNNQNCKCNQNTMQCNGMNMNNNMNQFRENDRHCVNRELMYQMKSELQSTDFAIEDLALYLDTHPDDMRAVCMHNQYAKDYRKLSDEYQKVYGPLNIMFPCNSWRWLEEPWPWQKNDNCPQMQNCRKEKITSGEIEDYEEDFDLKGGIM